MFENCIQCGLCRDVCLIEKIGYESLVTFSSGASDKESLAWICANCWQCQEECPQGVNIIQEKHRMQRELPHPPAIKNGLNNIRQCGYCLPISRELIEARIQEGLSEFELLNPQLISSLLD